MKASLTLLIIFISATSANLSPDSRVMGGDEAIPHSLPFMIRFFIERHLRMGMEACGGSLISPSRIISAGHCFQHGDHRMVHSILVIAGAHNYQIIEPTQQRRTLTTGWHVHPDYDDNLFPFPNDIAVILLEVPFTLNAYVAVIAIPPQDYPERFAGVMGTFSGWGGRGPLEGLDTSRLRVASNLIISNERCNAYYGGVIPDSMLCIETLGGIDYCMGDCGGPLTVNVNDSLLQVGVIGKDPNHCNPLDVNPSFYGRVADFSDWIMTVGL